MALAEYLKIRQYVLDLIYKSGNQEQQIASNRALAAKFDVTLPTIQKALKDLINDGYLTIKPGVGSFTNPGKILNHMNSDLTFIGIIVGDGKFVYYDKYYWQTVSELGNAVINNNCYLRIINLMNNGPKLRDELLSMKLDGIIWIYPLDPAVRVIEKIQRERSLPIVSLVDSVKNIDHVIYDFEYEGYEVVRQLLANNRPNIVYAAKRKDRERSLKVLQGMRQAYRDANVHPDERLLLEDNGQVVQSIKKLLSSGVKFDAVYCEQKYLRPIIEFSREEGLDDLWDKFIVSPSYNLEPLMKFRGMLAQYRQDNVAATLLAELLRKIKERDHTGAVSIRPEIIFIDN